MDCSAESYFVKTYIRKERQERLLFQLTNSKKRYEGLDRFCHNSADLIDKRKIVLKGDDLDRQKDFLKFADKNNKPCLIISPDSFIDGEVMNLKEAVAVAVNLFEAVIIIGNGFALVFGEVEKGGREKYLLAEKQNA